MTAERDPLDELVAVKSIDCLGIERVVWVRPSGVLADLTDDMREEALAILWRWKVEKDHPGSPR